MKSVSVLPRSGSGISSTPDVRIVYEEGGQLGLEIWDIKTRGVGKPHGIETEQFRRSGTSDLPNLRNYRLIMLGGTPPPDIFKPHDVLGVPLSIHHIPNVKASATDLHRAVGL